MGLEVHDGPQAAKPRGKAGKPTQETQTFSQQVMAQANRVEFEDWQAGGFNRRVGMRSPRGGDAMRLARILSQDDAAKTAVFNQAMLAFCIVELDGEPVPRPASELQIEVLLDRLGFAGIQAAAQAFERLGQGGSSEDAKN